MNLGGVGTHFRPINRNEGLFTSSCWQKALSHLSPAGIAGAQLTGVALLNVMPLFLVGYKGLAFASIQDNWQIWQGKVLTLSPQAEGSSQLQNSPTGAPEL